MSSAAPRWLVPVFPVPCITPPWFKGIYRNSRVIPGNSRVISALDRSLFSIFAPVSIFAWLQVLPYAPPQFPRCIVYVIPVFFQYPPCISVVAGYRIVNSTMYHMVRFSQNLAFPWLPGYRTVNSTMTRSRPPTPPDIFATVCVPSRGVWVYTDPSRQKKREKKVVPRNGACQCFLSRTAVVVSGSALSTLVSCAHCL